MVDYEAPSPHRFLMLKHGLKRKTSIIPAYWNV
ncbi:hypothetical protein bas49_0137 [Escherichia phage EmilHeitz]|uniref:Uncharacterized protein n=1 Tax=Escherichia phage EmilHeitz TaxID=2852021 RepID=A0AAE7VR33_9CAUD|nr:hypothetical protein bas49_0137 [Escherichia phage EmilHeitz]